MCVCRSRALSQIITIKLCVGVLVTQLCPTLCNSMNYSPPGFPVHGILQARIVEWVAISFLGIQPAFPASQAVSLLSEPPGKLDKGHNKQKRKHNLPSWNTSKEH